jgi:hydrogenase nickel incorporation protein HypA/HybF
MHELAITEHLLQLALDYADQAHAQRITALNLVIGQLSSVVDDSVQFYWDIASKGTIAEYAKLQFERVPCKLKCEKCEAECLFDAYSGECPSCGAGQISIVGGDEFQLKSIEIVGTK